MMPFTSQKSRELNKNPSTKLASKSEIELVSKKVEKTKQEIEQLKSELQKLVELGLAGEKTTKTDINLEIQSSKSNDQVLNFEKNEIKTNDVDKPILPFNPSETDCFKVDNNLQHNILSSRKNDVPNHDDVKIEYHKKKLEYDKEEAREYIKKQREKRAEERRKQMKETRNELEIRKQKLKELHERTLQLVSKNLKHKRDKSKSREKLDNLRVPINLEVPKVAQLCHRIDKPSATNSNKSLLKSSKSNLEITTKNAQVVFSNLEKKSPTKSPKSLRKEKHCQITKSAPDICSQISPGKGSRKNQQEQRKEKHETDVPTKNFNFTKNPVDNFIEILSAIKQKQQKSENTLKNELSYTTMSELISKYGNFKPKSNSNLNDVTENNDILNKAATKIQAYYRGFRQRKKIQILPKKSKTTNVKENPKIEWLQTSSTIPNPYNFMDAVKRKLTDVILGKSEQSNSSDKSSFKSESSEEKFEKKRFKTDEKHRKINSETSTSDSQYTSDFQQNQRSESSVKSSKKITSKSSKSDKKAKEVEYSEDFSSTSELNNFNKNSNNIKTSSSFSSPRTEIEFSASKDIRSEIESRITTKRGSDEQLSDLNVFLSNKCLNLDLDSIKPLFLKSQINNTRVQNGNVFQNDSDSDTSKNIPDISTESSTPLNNTETRSFSNDNANKTENDFKLEIDSKKMEKLRMTRRKVHNINDDTIQLMNFNGTDKEKIIGDSNSKSNLSKSTKNQIDDNKSIVSRNVSKSHTKSSNLKTVFSDKDEEENDDIKRSNNTILSSHISYMQSVGVEAFTKPQSESLENKSNESDTSSKSITTLLSAVKYSRSNNLKIGETSQFCSNEKIENNEKYSSDFSCSSNENHNENSFDSKVPSLKRPSIKLSTSHVTLHTNNKNNKHLTDINRQTELKKTLDTKIDSNEIHLKFEAEIRLLHHFNQSLQEAVEKEKSLIENKFVPKNKNVISKEEVPKNVNTSSTSNSTTKIVTINYSRGSDVSDNSIPNLTRNKDSTNLLDTSSLLSTNFQVLSSVQNSIVDSEDINTTISLDDKNKKEEICNGVSLGVIDQLIQDEDVRIENLKTILKIREKSLLDRTKSELAWLEIQKKHLRDSGQLHEISMIKKKQRGLLVKLQLERHEMQRLKQMQKAASKERKTLLRQQRNMIKAQLSTNKNLTRLKSTSSRERRNSSGPLKVISVHSCNESILSETSSFRRNSSAATGSEEIVSVMSRSHSIVTDVVSVHNDKSQNEMGNAHEHQRTKEQVEKSRNEHFIKRSLLMRETALQKRRKIAEELLQWHQRLVEEERQIAELETAANSIINQVAGDSASCVRKTGANFTFKGCQLNVMWQNMTGKQEKRFKDNELYIMSKEALEQFCKDAKKIDHNASIDGIFTEYEIQSEKSSSEAVITEKIRNIPVGTSSNYSEDFEDSEDGKKESIIVQEDSELIEKQSQNNLNLVSSEPPEIDLSGDQNVVEDELNTECSVSRTVPDVLHVVSSTESQNNSQEIEEAIGKENVAIPEMPDILHKTSNSEKSKNSSPTQLNGLCSILSNNSIKSFVKEPLSKSLNFVISVKENEKIEEEKNSNLSASKVDFSLALDAKHSSISEEDEEDSTSKNIEDLPDFSSYEKVMNSEEATTNDHELEVISENNLELNIDSNGYIAVSKVEEIEEDIVKINEEFSNDNLVEKGDDLLQENELSIEESPNVISSPKEEIFGQKSCLSKSDSEIPNQIDSEDDTENILPTVKSSPDSLPQKSVNSGANIKKSEYSDDFCKLSTEETQKENEELLIQTDSQSLEDLESDDEFANLNLLSPNDSERNIKSTDSEDYSEVRKRIFEILSEVNSPRNDRSPPRLQDIYTTTYDVLSPVVSPESERVVSSKQILPRPTYTSAEEAELLQKQLAIEQEIKQIEQQQQQKRTLPYVFLREIPNKPPPPYTPPTPTPVLPSILPASAEQVNLIVHHLSSYLFNAYQTNKLPNIDLLPDIKKRLQPQVEPQCQKFIFDLCKELTIEHYKQFEEKNVPLWMRVQKRPKLLFEKPLDERGLEKFLMKKVKTILGYETVPKKESMIIKWSRKKRDHVDELLVLESQQEEVEWTNYDKDELIVINDITNDILESLMKETTETLREIVAKKNKRL